MSDPVKQGEQVDVEAARHTANVWARGYDETLVAEKNLALAYLDLRERVRLLEQREKGLREAVEWWLNDQGGRVFADRESRYTIEDLLATHREYVSATSGEEEVEGG